MCWSRRLILKNLTENIIFYTFRYTPIPDSVLSKAVGSGEHNTAVDSKDQKFGLNFPGDMTPGFSTPAGNPDIF